MPSHPHATPAPDLVLYAHPISSYCQKVLIPPYENDTPFDSLCPERERDPRGVADARDEPCRARAPC